MPCMSRSPIIENFVVTSIGSLMLIAMGVVYFIIILFIVNFSSGLMGHSPDANVLVLSSAVIVTGVMIGSALKKN